MTNLYKSLQTFLILCTFILSSTAQTGISVPSMSVCDDLVLDFIEKFEMRGATLVLSFNEKVIYSRSFGFADDNKSIFAQPYNMFRIASVSKPLTAIGIYKLIEDNKLSLTDKVFGDDAIFKDHPAYLNANIQDDRIYEITVQQLLEHTAGWDRDLPCFPSPVPPYNWNQLGCDPIAVPLYITSAVGADNPVETEDYIQYLLNIGLEHTPGTQYAYSNTGYTMLGRIIEIISDKDYETFMKEDIFNHSGAYDIYITSNKKENKHPREVEYEDNNYQNFHINGSGELTSASYEGYAIEQMDSHGGWMTSGIDLMKVLMSVDKRGNKEDILKTSSIENMITPSNVNAGYGKGWSVNSFKNYWHAGEILGTSSIAAVTDFGFNFVLIFNARNTDPTGSFWTELNDLPWNCYSETNTVFPSHDLSLHPIAQVSDLNAIEINNSSAKIRWKQGSGNKTLVTISQNNFDNSFPTDGTKYNDNKEFGLGQEISEGEYALYYGSANEIMLEGLDPEKEYTIKAYSVTENSETGFHPLYLIHDAPAKSFTTSLTNTAETLISENFLIIPNPSNGLIKVQTLNNFKPKFYTVYDITGKNMANGSYPVNGILNFENLPSAHYFLKLIDQNNVAIKKIEIISQ